jgi:hypothetical protein
MDILEFEHRLSVRNGIQVMTVRFSAAMTGDERPVVGRKRAPNLLDHLDFW